MVLQYCDKPLLFSTRETTSGKCDLFFSFSNLRSSLSERWYLYWYWNLYVYITIHWINMSNTYVEILSFRSFLVEIVSHSSLSVLFSYLRFPLPKWWYMYCPQHLHLHNVLGWYNLYDTYVQRYFSFETILNTAAKFIFAHLSLFQRSVCHRV